MDGRIGREEQQSQGQMNVGKPKRLGGLRRLLLLLLASSWPAIWPRRASTQQHLARVSSPLSSQFTILCVQARGKQTEKWLRAGVGVD
jgi:hypothetical protein